jgi:hypothetical protein
MTQLQRLRVEWGGSLIPGGGLSTFYATTTGSGFPAGVKSFFTAFAHRIPTGVTWTVPTFGDLIEDSTGALAGSWSEPSGGGQVASSGTAAHAAGVGTRVVWQTGGIHNGRRVKGSTFIVPLSQGVYDTSGTIDSLVLADIQQGVNTLLTAVPNLRILSKARPGFPGASSAITAGTVPDKVSWLRSRRV